MVGGISGGGMAATTVSGDVLAISPRRERDLGLVSAEDFPSPGHADSTSNLEDSGLGGGAGARPVVAARLEPLGGK